MCSEADAGGSVQAGVCDFCALVCEPRIEDCANLTCSVCGRSVFHQDCVNDYLKRTAFHKRTTRKEGTVWGFPCMQGRGKVPHPEGGECRGKITQSLTMRGMLQSQAKKARNIASAVAASTRGVHGHPAPAPVAIPKKTSAAPPIVRATPATGPAGVTALNAPHHAASQLMGAPSELDQYESGVELQDAGPSGFFGALPALDSDHLVMAADEALGFSYPPPEPGDFRVGGIPMAAAPEAAIAASVAAPSLDLEILPGSWRLHTGMPCCTDVVIKQQVSKQRPVEALASAPPHTVLKGAALSPKALPLPPPPPPPPNFAAAMKHVAAASAAGDSIWEGPAFSYFCAVTPPPPPPPPRNQPASAAPPPAVPRDIDTGSRTFASVVAASKAVPGPSPAPGAAEASRQLMLPGLGAPLRQAAIPVPAGGKRAGLRAAGRLAVPAAAPAATGRKGSTAAAAAASKWSAASSKPIELAGRQQRRKEGGKAVQTKKGLSPSNSAAPLGPLPAAHGQGSQQHRHMEEAAQTGADSSAASSPTASCQPGSASAHQQLMLSPAPSPPIQFSQFPSWQEQQQLHDVRRLPQPALAPAPQFTMSSPEAVHRQQRQQQQQQVPAPPSRLGFFLPAVEAVQGANGNSSHQTPAQQHHGDAECVITKIRRTTWWEEAGVAAQEAGPTGVGAADALAAGGSKGAAAGQAAPPAPQFSYFSFWPS